MKNETRQQSYTRITDGLRAFQVKETEFLKLAQEARDMELWKHNPQAWQVLLTAEANARTVRRLMNGGAQ